jgi:hypothetical protein
MEQFPPNSRKERASTREPNRVEQVTSNARRRRRPVGKQFKSVFFGGDARTAVEYMVFEIAVPEIKAMFVDTLSSGLERWILGDRGSRRRGMSPYAYGSHTNYGGISRGPMRSGPETGHPAMPRMMSRQARVRNDFGEIILDKRQDAEEVLDRMYDMLSKYNEVTVADLYALTGMQSTHVDTKWGWEDLTNAGVGRLRGGGYILNLPEPEVLK